MRYCILRLAFVVLTLAWSCVPIRAADKANQVARFVAAVAEAGANNSDEALARAVGRYIAVAEMAASAAGGKDAGFSDALHIRYLQSYRALLHRFLKKRLDRLRPESLAILGVKQAGNGIELVYTRLRLPPDSDHDIIWYVLQTGTPGIVDVAYDGIRFTDRQRQEFDAILDRHGGDLTVLPNAIDALDR